MTYRARYQRRPELLPVLDLLVLDELNPHSICLPVGGTLWPARPDQNPARLRAAEQSALGCSKRCAALIFSYLEELRQSQAEPLSALLAAGERAAYGHLDELTQRFFVHAG